LYSLRPVSAQQDLLRPLNAPRYSVSVTPSAPERTSQQGAQHHNNGLAVEGAATTKNKEKMKSGGQATSSGGGGFLSLQQTTTTSDMYWTSEKLREWDSGRDVRADTRTLETHLQLSSQKNNRATEEPPVIAEQHMNTGERQTRFQLDTLVPLPPQLQAVVVATPPPPPPQGAYAPEAAAAVVENALLHYPPQPPFQGQPMQPQQYPPQSNICAPPFIPNTTQQHNTQPPMFSSHTTPPPPPTGGPELLISQMHIQHPPAPGIHNSQNFVYSGCPQLLLPPQTSSCFTLPIASAHQTAISQPEQFHVPPPHHHHQCTFPNQQFQQLIQQHFPPSVQQPQQQQHLYPHVPFQHFGDPHTNVDSQCTLPFEPPPPHLYHHQRQWQESTSVLHQYPSPSLDSHHQPPPASSMPVDKVQQFERWLAAKTKEKLKDQERSMKSKEK
jgi:hypothetical protein